MIRELLATVWTLGVLVLGAAEGEQTLRVDFAAEPEGADVIVDGALRGRAPLTLYDLAPGDHHVRFEKRDYEPKDAFFELKPGVYSLQSVQLAPVKGLLLVTSEPAGCDLSLDGLSLGETPRLVTKLEAKETYRLKLQKPGYQPRTLEVKFNGRTPLVKHEKLILDSGILQISSDPAGAAVSVNGIARGATPVTVRDVPKGSATVVLRKPGYAEVVRELTLNAGDSQTLFLKLEGVPGMMKLSSVPEGARFYVNGVAQGKGPQTMARLKPGAYVVRAELDGFGTVEKTLQVGNGETVNEEFRLESILSRLEIRTKPADAQVFVDGHSCGTTRAANEAAEVSDVLSVPNLKAGEHTVIIRRSGYGEVVKHPVLEASKATALDVKMKRIFLPDIEIETNTGTYRGVLIENGPTALLIEVSMGVSRSFPRADIRKITMLEIPQQ